MADVLRRIARRSASRIWVAGVLTLAACRREPTPREVPIPPSAMLPEVVPVPAGVMAEIVVSRPGATWEVVRSGVLLAVPWCPVRFAALATRIGVPAAYAGEIVEDAPLVGVLVGKEKVGWVFSVAVQSGRGLTAALTTGNVPTHSLREGRHGLQILEARAAGAWGSLGILENRLYWASSGAILEAYSPHLARNVIRRSERPEAVVVRVTEEALAGRLPDWLGAFWAPQEAQLLSLAEQSRQAHGGRSADFADPAGVLRWVGAQVRWIGEMSRASQELEFSAQPGGLGWMAEVTIQPKPGELLQRDVQSMATGDLSPLAALSPQTQGAVMVRSSLEARRQSAQSAVESLSEMLGERLAPGDRQRGAVALAQLAEGRGDTLVLALLESEGIRFGKLRSAVIEPKVVDAGLRGLLSFLASPALAEPLGWPPTTTIRFDSVRGADGSEPLTRARIGGAVGGNVPPMSHGFAWRIEAGELLGTLGPEPEKRLGALADGQGALGKEPMWAAAFGRAGTEVNQAWLYRPVVSLPGSARGSLFALGKARDRLLMRLEADPDTLSAVAQMLSRLH